MKRITTIALILMACTAQTHASAASWNVKGHSKYRYFYTHYDDDAWFSQWDAQDTSDHFLDIRLMADKRWDQWDANIHYQLTGLSSDTLKAARAAPQTASIFAPGVISDKSRLFNLTHVFHDEDGQILLHRLDRLTVGYTGRSLVVRLGRQAVSWGNGLLYNPVDMFNPFAPDAVDKDYKTGDDLAYGQWLFASGDDVQGVMVPRRNRNTGKVEADYSSLAAKYHGFIGGKEYDLLAARHYGDNLIAAGAAMDWLGTVVRGDVLATHTGSHTVMSAVANISYSWVWFEKNLSGSLEYFYNGFGQNANNYSPEALADNPQLVDRIQRGELYTLGKHYLGASVSLETTPLTLLNTNLFVNAADPSALLQLVYNVDWHQDLTVFAGFSVPMGSDGSEFGGIPSGTPGVYFSSGNAVFAQLAYYF